MNTAHPRAIRGGPGAGVPALLLAVLLALPGYGAKPKDPLAEARAAYLASEFDRAIAACVGQDHVEAKLITCLSLYERYKLYRLAEDGKRAKVLFGILRLDLTLAHADTLRQFFNAPGHPVGNDKAADLLRHILKRSGTANDCRIVANLLRQDIGPQAAHHAYRGLERHLENVRTYVNRGGTMPEVERALFQDESFLRVLAEGLRDKKTDRAALACLVAIEEPALAYLEKWNEDLPTSRAILKIKEAQARRLKKYPHSTWDSAFGRGDMPAPSAIP